MNGDHPEPGKYACTDCGSVLLGEEIRLTPGRTRRQDRRIPLAGRDRHAIVWQCPDCGHLWPRYPEGHRRHPPAMAMIAAHIVEQARQAKAHRP